jgi:monomeric sarcosine oxidase
LAGNVYDVIVVGAGGVGSAALWQLAKRGVRVLGVDRFPPPHDRGSSHGHTRIIRQAYFEHADYVPLLLRSYELWEELESVVAKQLKFETGLLQIGPPNGEVVPGVLKAADLHGLAVDSFSSREVSKRWPAIRPPEDSLGVFERRAGYLRVEECVAACLSAAQQAGAELMTDVEVYGWRLGDDITLHTSRGDLTANRLIVAAGPWAGQLLASLNVPLEVRRKPLMWFPSNDPTTRADAGFPCYLFELPQGVFYGFPQIDQHGLKMGEHSAGEPVADPLNVDRSLRQSDLAPVEAFAARCLPTLKPTCTKHVICMYTMSPDEHFIVDRQPDDPRVAFAAGLSGHGFKFTPVLGQALAELILDGQTELPIAFLSLQRFEQGASP